MAGQAGWRQTGPGSGTATVTVTSGQVLTGVEFGNVCLGSIAVSANVAVRVEEVSVPGILGNDPTLPGLRPAPRRSLGCCCPAVWER